MKYVLQSMVLILCSFFFTSYVDAAGAISQDEQMIIQELTQPILIQGKEFQMPQTYITQTENYLKQNDLSKSQVDTAVKNIQNVKQKLTNLDIDLSSVHTINDLIKIIPRETILEIQQLISSTADALGLVVLSWNKGYVELGTQNSDGSISAVFNSKQPIKQTGTFPISSILAIGCLIMTATGAFIVGKKVKLA